MRSGRLRGIGDSVYLIVFMYLRICAFVYLCICVFVFDVRSGRLRGIGGSVFLPRDLSATDFGEEEEDVNNQQGENLSQIGGEILFA